ncbi:MAG: hypothetical protein O7B81_03040 [Gammaproteobacteria bacterium]|nr:hypothetical protein [Gammaproteobacteria bacterium]
MFVGPRVVFASPDLDAWLAEIVSDQPLMRQPLRTGKLRRDDLNALEAISAQIVVSWDFEGHSEYGDYLTDDLGLKTEEAPSYLTEYEEAAEVWRRTTAEMDNDLDAFWLLLTHGSVADERGRAGRVKTFVLSELITYHVVHGGFRRFGYKNYNGYISGQFSDHQNLPYRGAGE